MRFSDRTDAGRRLGARLQKYGFEHPIVLALPRGGVPVGAEVARALGVPLSVLVVRKLGTPWHPELGVGAIAEDGTVYIDAQLCDALHLGAAELREVARREQAEVQRRIARYRQGRPLPHVAGRTVILVDDGVATGGTALAAVRALRSLGAERIVLAAPVAALQAIHLLESEADEVVSLLAPPDLQAVGLWYDDFAQVDDDQVTAMLAGGEAAPAAHDVEREVVLRTGRAVLQATLGVPERASGLVVFAHGSGSSRKSPRNRRVAAALRAAGFATALIDLFTPDEELEDDAGNGRLRFDIDFLTHRLIEATDAVRALPGVQGLPIGWFGASTGAAAALAAAALRPELATAVVSRGGRPDLAVGALPYVLAPTLLIVGGADDVVLELNKEALAELRCEKNLVIVPRASHLFEEPGALDQVAAHAAAWFAEHLAKRAESVARP